MPKETASGLECAGFTVAGVLAAERFDALVHDAWRSDRIVSGARSVVVLGTAGGRFESRLAQRLAGASSANPAHTLAVRASSANPADTLAVRASSANPADTLAEFSLAEATTALGLAGAIAHSVPYFERRTPGGFIDFVALAHASGIGTPGRLGLLLHPQYGPWLALRGLLVTDLLLDPTPPRAAFAPCDGCPAPCASACPGAALQSVRIDVGLCASTRQRLDGCRKRCDARRACVLGPEHRYPDVAELHYARASYAYIEQAGERRSGLRYESGDRLRSVEGGGE